MDCLHAQQVLSESMDGEIAAGELAEATAHCASCQECARFARSLERMAALPTPVAPAALVERLVTLGRNEAAEIRSAAGSDAIETSIPETPVNHNDAPRRLPSWWAPRLTAYAAAAAVLLVALVATGAGLARLGRHEASTLSDSVQTPGGDRGATAPSSPNASESAKDAYGQLAGTPAPPYVVIDGLVYAPTGPRTVDASSLVTATPAVTALDTGGDPVSMPAYHVGAGPGTAVLRATDGTYLGFSAVTRTFGGKALVLQSGTPVTAYGQWPTLPGRFPAPSASDGSPTFSFFGKDDLGMAIFVPPGGRPTEGFAVAPGTPSTDPAAGNPNWTWWQSE